MIIIYGNGFSSSWGMAIFIISVLFSMFSTNQHWHEEAQLLIFLVIFCLAAWYGLVQMIEQFQGQGFFDNQADQSDQSDVRSSAQTQLVSDKLSSMPLETFCPKQIIKELSIKELKQRLKDRSIDINNPNFVEKNDFVEALASHHSSEQTSCVICFEDFDESSVLRILRNCKHCFHIECIDRWLLASTSHNGSDESNKMPCCPLCKSEL